MIIINLSLSYPVCVCLCACLCVSDSTGLVAADSGEVVGRVKGQRETGARCQRASISRPSFHSSSGQTATQTIITGTHTHTHCVFACFMVFSSRESGCSSLYQMKCLRNNVCASRLIVFASSFSSSSFHHRPSCKITVKHAAHAQSHFGGKNVCCGTEEMQLAISSLTEIGARLIAAALVAPCWWVTSWHCSQITRNPLKFWLVRFEKLTGGKVFAFAKSAKSPPLPRHTCHSLHHLKRRTSITVGHCYNSSRGPVQHRRKKKLKSWHYPTSNL